MLIILIFISGIFIRRVFLNFEKEQMWEKPGHLRFWGDSLDYHMIPHKGGFGLERIENVVGLNFLEMTGWVNLCCLRRLI